MALTNEELREKMKALNKALKDKNQERIEKLTADITNELRRRQG